MGKFFLKRDYSFLLILVAVTVPPLVVDLKWWVQIPIFVAAWLAVTYVEDLWARAELHRRVVEAERRIRERERGL